MANFHRCVPSLCRRKIEWSALGEATRPYEHEEPEDLPLCGRCLDVDVFPHSEMQIQVLTYKEAGQEERTWHITVDDFCDDCSTDGRNAQRREACLARIQ